MFVIGITGNIACGKSTIDAMLVDLGATLVLDADPIVHAILREDAAVFQKILTTFGDAILAADSSIDRRSLGRIVFSDAIALQRLESILYPVVRRRIREQVEAAPPSAIVVIDAVKLLEGELRTLVDTVWWVTATPEQQLERLCARGLTEEDARARCALQPSLSTWQDSIDVIIDNSGSLAYTRSQVENAWRERVVQRTEQLKQ